MRALFLSFMFLATFIEPEPERFSSEPGMDSIPNVIYGNNRLID